MGMRRDGQAGGTAHELFLRNGQVAAKVAGETGA